MPPQSTKTTQPKIVRETQFPALSSLNLDQLARSKSVPEIIDWLETILLPQIKASSCVLLWTRTQPSLRLIPIFSTDSGYQTMLKEPIKQPGRSIENLVPLFALWKEFETPITRKLDDIPREQRGSWYVHFQRMNVENVTAIGCNDVSGRHLTYLFLTAPPEAHAQDVQSLLAIITPIIHSILGQVRRRKVQRKKDKAHTLLTTREIEVLEWVRKGKTNSEISKILDVTFPTIKNHLQKIMIKLRVNNRAEAVGKGYGLDAQDTKLVDTLLSMAVAER